MKNWTKLLFGIEFQNKRQVLPEIQTLCHSLHDPGLPPPVAPVPCCVSERGEVEAGCSGEEKIGGLEFGK